MRTLRLCLIGLLTVTPGVTLAQLKAAPKPATGPEVRYFTSIDGLMDGNADVVLKEVRQGKAVTSAVLDVCYPAEKGSDRKDRFVANLTANGGTLAGAATSVADKLPVAVKLTRKPTGDTYEFKGQISVGQTVTEVASEDNTDLSEREFQEIQSSDDAIATAPKDFTEVSPESIAVKIRLEAVPDFLKSLKGENVEVLLNSLAVSCDALRASQQVVYLTVDPERAAAFVAKAKSAPGVIAAGWSSGLMELDRTVRVPAADWRDGGKLNRDKVAAGIADVLANVLSAKLAAKSWSDSSGKLKLTFKRANLAFPTLELTDVIEVTALVSPDKPGGADALLLWVSGPQTTTIDEGAGARLTLAESTGGDEEGEQRSDVATIAALAQRLKGQRWDADKSEWK